MDAELSYITAPTTPLECLSGGEVLRHAAAATPDRAAVVFYPAGSDEPASLTFAELLAAAESAARRLLETFEAGDRIAVWSDNRPEWLVAQFGVALAGMVLVPANPMLKPVEVEYVLRHSGAVACLSVTDHRGQDLIDVARAIGDTSPRLRLVEELGAWCSTPASQDPAVLPAVSADSVAMVQYTSGTTGFPKGAEIVHGRIYEDVVRVGERAGLTSPRAWLMPLPLFHAGGCVLGVLGAFARSTTIVLMERWSAAEALRLVERERVEVLNPVPTMLQGLIDEVDVSSHDVGSLRTLLAGGAQVSAENVRDIEEKLDARVSIIFGQTECGPVTTMTTLDDTAQDRQDTVGTPLPGFEIRVVDPESGQVVPRGTVGELHVRGNTMLGYVGEDATRGLDADGWMHTGDLCEIDDRDHVRVRGRLKEMIIRGGENIYPLEVERVLSQVPGVADVAVVGLPHERLGETVAAFVVVEPGAAVTQEQVRDVATTQLAHYKVPETWVFTSELPRTATGKVQKRLLAVPRSR